MTASYVVKPRAVGLSTDPLVIVSQPDRWWRWVADRALHCPEGHPISNRFRPHECGFVQCSHGRRHSDRQTECGLWIFVFLVRGGSAFIFEVSPAEQRDLAQLLTPADIVSALGVFTL